MLNQATLYNVEHQKSDLRALRQFIFSRWEEAGQLQPILKSGLRWVFSERPTLTLIPIKLERIGICNNPEREFSLQGLPMADSQTLQYFIQYDGLSLGEHSIDLADLGESLQGFSKVLACAGNFIQSGQFNRRYSALNVSVSTSANLEAGCIEIPVWITANAPELFSGFAGSVLTAVVAYVLSKRGKEEMEHLAAALKQSLSQNQELQGRLLETIDKLADGLTAASRQAMHPVGRSCQTVCLLDKDKKSTGISVDKLLKDHFDQAKEQVITKETTYTGRISELDRVTGTCKISLDDDPDDMRITGLISDPLLQVSNNPYVASFANNNKLQFKAKAQLDQNGDIVKLFISDAVVQQEE